MECTAKGPGGSRHTFEYENDNRKLIFVSALFSTRLIMIFVLGLGMLMVAPVNARVFIQTFKHHLHTESLFLSQPMDLHFVVEQAFLFEEPVFSYRLRLLSASAAIVNTSMMFGGNDPLDCMCKASAKRGTMAEPPVRCDVSTFQCFSFAKASTEYYAVFWHVKLVSSAESFPVDWKAQARTMRVLSRGPHRGKRIKMGKRFSKKKKSLMGGIDSVADVQMYVDEESLRQEQQFQTEDASGDVFAFETPPPGPCSEHKTAVSCLKGITVEGPCIFAQTDGMGCISARTRLRVQEAEQSTLVLEFDEDDDNYVAQPRITTAAAVSATKRSWSRGLMSTLKTLDVKDPDVRAKFRQKYFQYVLNLRPVPAGPVHRRIFRANYTKENAVHGRSLGDDTAECTHQLANLSQAVRCTKAMVKTQLLGTSFAFRVSGAAEFTSTAPSTSKVSAELEWFGFAAVVFDQDQGFGVRVRVGTELLLPTFEFPVSYLIVNVNTSIPLGGEVYFGQCAAGDNSCIELRPSLDAGLKVAVSGGLGSSSAVRAAVGVEVEGKLFSFGMPMWLHINQENYCLDVNLTRNPAKFEVSLFGELCAAPICVFGRCIGGCVKASLLQSNYTFANAPWTKNLITDWCFDSPYSVPTFNPTYTPTSVTGSPSWPTRSPTWPTSSPALSTGHPSTVITTTPTFPSTAPTNLPSVAPSRGPTKIVSKTPTTSPSFGPSVHPSQAPSRIRTTVPSSSPTIRPTLMPTTRPSTSPNAFPAQAPVYAGSCSTRIDYSFGSLSLSSQMRFGDRGTSNYGYQVDSKRHDWWRLCGNSPYLLSGIIDDLGFHFRVDQTGRYAISTVQVGAASPYGSITNVMVFACEQGMTLGCSDKGNGTSSIDQRPVLAQIEVNLDSSVNYAIVVESSLDVQFGLDIARIPGVTNELCVTSPDTIDLGEMLVQTGEINAPGPYQILPGLRDQVTMTCGWDLPGKGEMLFRFAIPERGSYNIATFPISMFFDGTDTVLQLFSCSQSGQVTSIICNDDAFATNLFAAVDVFLAPGTYIIAVGRYGTTARANFGVKIERRRVYLETSLAVANPLARCNLNPKLTKTSGPATWSFTSYDNTDTFPMQCGGPNAGSYYRLYEINPFGPGDMDDKLVQVFTTKVNYPVDTVLQLHECDGGGAANVVACNDNIQSTIYSSITAMVRSDRKYYVVLALQDSSYLNLQVEINLNVLSEHPAPVTDWRLAPVPICINPDRNLGVLDSYSPVFVVPDETVVNRTAFLTTDGRNLPRDVRSLTNCAKDRTDTQNTMLGLVIHFQVATMRRLRVAMMSAMGPGSLFVMRCTPSTLQLACASNSTVDQGGKVYTPNAELFFEPNVTYAIYVNAQGSNRAISFMVVISSTDGPNGPATGAPSSMPSSMPSAAPASAVQTGNPTPKVTGSPTSLTPTQSPLPTTNPSVSPSSSTPTKSPSASPWSSNPTKTPSGSPIFANPSKAPSTSPSSSNPTKNPSIPPSFSNPSKVPSASPWSPNPTKNPSIPPSFSNQSKTPSASPWSPNPTKNPSIPPSFSNPSKAPSASPFSPEPVKSPSVSQSSTIPTRSPSWSLTGQPTGTPSVKTSILATLNVNCSNDEVAVGLQGSQGAWVDALGFVCAKRSDIKIIRKAVVAVSTGGGMPFDVRCSANFVIDEISGFGLVPEVLTRTYVIRFRCRNVVDWSEEQQINYGPVNSTGVPTGNVQRCPEGYFLQATQWRSAMSNFFEEARCVSWETGNVIVPAPVPATFQPTNSPTLPTTSPIRMPSKNPSSSSPTKDPSISPASSNQTRSSSTSPQSSGTPSVTATLRPTLPTLNVNCSNDEVAVGLQGSQGSWVGTLGFVCAKRADLSIIRRAVVTVGTDGGMPFEVRCSANFVIDEISGFGLVPEVLTRTYVIRFRCRNVVDWSEEQQINYGPVNSTGVPTGNVQRCPEGYFLQATHWRSAMSNFFEEARCVSWETGNVIVPAPVPATFQPTNSPTLPTTSPIRMPSKNPSSSSPTKDPSISPASSHPTWSPTTSPSSSHPTKNPSASPSSSTPSESPSRATNSPISNIPTVSPTRSQPTWSPASPSPSTSGPTSASNNVPCGIDEIAIGLHGYQGSWTDSLGFVCGKLSNLSSSRGAASPRTLGGQPYQVLCPQNFAMFEIQGFSLIPEIQGRNTAVRFRCRDVMNVSMTAALITYGTNQSNGTGTGDLTRCPDGYYFRSVQWQYLSLLNRHVPDNAFNEARCVSWTTGNIIIPPPAPMSQQPTESPSFIALTASPSDSPITPAPAISPSTSPPSAGTVQYNINCTSDEFLVGFYGKQGSWTEGLGALCGLRTDLNIVRESSLIVLSNYNAHSFDSRCSPDFAVVSVQGVALVPSVAGRNTALRFNCRHIDDPTLLEQHLTYGTASSQANSIGPLQQCRSNALMSKLLWTYLLEGQSLPENIVIAAVCMDQQTGLEVPSLMDPATTTPSTARGTMQPTSDLNTHSPGSASTSAGVLIGAAVGGTIGIVGVLALGGAGIAYAIRRMRGTTEIPMARLVTMQTEGTTHPQLRDITTDRRTGQFETVV